MLKSSEKEINVALNWSILSFKKHHSPKLQSPHYNFDYFLVLRKPLNNVLLNCFNYKLHILVLYIWIYR